MFVPVNNVIKYGVPIATTVFNTDTCKFIEQEYTGDSQLPNIDYLTGSIVGNSSLIILGRNNNEYVICYGNTSYYSVNITPENSEQTEYADLSHIFAEDTFSYLEELRSNSSGSQGVCRKFIGVDKRNNKLGVVKFADTDIMLYESVYHTVGELLGCDVCSAEMGMYGGKPCVISYYNYDVEKDVFVSFKQKMTAEHYDLSRLLTAMGDKFQKQFDKVMILDFIMNQCDRHMSNLAILNNRQLYSLYDNGACLDTGTVGSFSENFRSYVKRMDRDYIKTLFKPITYDIIATELKRYSLSEKALEMIQSNMEELGL